VDLHCHWENRKFVEEFRKPEMFTRDFLRATNLREVYLCVRCNDHRLWCLVYFVLEWPFWVQGCKTLSKLTVEIPVRREIKHNKMISGTLRRIYKKLGIQGQPVGLVRKYQAEVAEVWNGKPRVGS
jgi:hypothetical protein